MKKIFLDKYGDLKAGWVAVIFLSLLGLVVAILCVAALGRNERLEARANYKAFCDSIGGSFGDMECYKDGVVVTKDQTLKMEVKND